MPTNHVQARNDIKTLFRTAWISGIQSGVADLGIPPLNFTDLAGTSYIPEIEWQRVESNANPLKDRHWARFTIKDVSFRQVSLADLNNKTIYTNYGLIIVQLFFARSRYDTVACESLEAIAHRVFVKSSLPEIIFRNATIEQLPDEEDFYRSNINAEYEFDYLR